MGGKDVATTVFTAAGARAGRADSSEHDRLGHRLHDPAMPTAAQTPLAGGVGFCTAEFAIDPGKVSASRNNARAYVDPTAGEIIDASRKKIEWRNRGSFLRTGEWYRSSIATC
jgi:hypothetical protein